MPFMELLHCTPKENVYSIMRYGIDPAFATGRLKSSWYCCEPALAWALSHISLKRRIAVSDMVVLRASVEFMTLKRTAWRYIYRCNEVVTPYSEMFNVEEFLDRPNINRGLR